MSRFDLLRDSTHPNLKEDNSLYFPCLVRVKNIYIRRKIFHVVVFIITVLNISILPLLKELFVKIYPIAVMMGALF